MPGTPLKSRPSEPAKPRRVRDGYTRISIISLKVTSSKIRISFHCFVAGGRAEQLQRRVDDLADELETARKRGEARAKDLSRQLQAALKRVEQLEAMSMSGPTATAAGGDRRPATAQTGDQKQTRAQTSSSSSSEKRPQSPIVALAGASANGGSSANGKSADTQSISSRGSNDEFVVVDEAGSSPLNLSGGRNQFNQTARKVPIKKPSNLQVTSPSG